MSSLRNSLHRRNHKERSQLAHRSRLGILEKHKDYVLRARDYHSKQDRLTRLRQKASERNKDEFYYGMNRQRTQKGVHVQDRGNSALPVDIVKILKSQDENYVRTMRTAGLKKIEKLKNQLSALADLLKPGLGAGEEDDEEGLDEDELEILREAGVLAGSHTSSRRKPSSKRASKHIVFAGDEAEARELAASRKTQSPPEADAMVIEEDDADLGWNFPSESKPLKKRTSKGGSQEDVSMEKELESEERKEASKLNRSRLLKELSARLHRDRMLRYAERELEMQKLLMGKGASKKLQGVERIGGDDADDADDEDALDARRGKKLSRAAPAVDEKAYKPRVYKWRAERKK